MSGRSEPLPGRLTSPHLLQVVRRHWLATRPAFFPASALPVVVGTAWGSGASDAFDPLRALLALLATVLVHAAANVLNDVADAAGSDAHNEQRIYPYTGGSRVIQNGVLTRRAMAAWGITLLAAAAAVGLALIALAGPLVLAFGLAGAALGVLYSLPPAQLAGRGAGELAIAIAFGVLPVTGAAWLQSGTLDAAALLISVPVGLWVAAILLINEVPDIVADAAAGKRTLPVRSGVRATRGIYVALQAGACATIAAAVVRGLLSPFALLALPLLLWLGLTAARGIRPIGEDRAALTCGIERTLAIHTLGCLWLAVWAFTG